MSDLSISSAAALTAATLASGDLVPILDVSASAGSKASRITADELAKWTGGGAFNVKRFGAKGDARRVDDAVTTGSGTTITSATAAFTAADVGKQIWGISAGGILRLDTTTIASVTNSTTIVVTDAAAGSATGVTLILGTDDTAALQAATAAAKAVSARGTIYAPAGGYIFSELPFDFGESAVVHAACGLLGDGSNCTVFYPSPDYDFGSVASNNGIFARFDGYGREGHIEGVRVEGHALSFSGGGSHWILSDSGNGTTLRDVRVEGLKGFTGHLLLVSADFLVDRCHFEGNGYLGIQVGGGGGTILNTYTGNHAYFGLYVSSVAGESNTGIHLSVVGGIIDECTYESCYISGSKDVKFTNVRFFGPVTKYACVVDGTSKARFVNCEVIDYGNTGNRGGLQVLSGGVAFVTACRFHGCGTLYGINNAGTVYDGGNNETNSKTGSAISASPAL